MAVLDNIVKVQISISNNAVPETSTFERMLILGTKPADAEATAKAFDYYESLAEITAAGWVSTEDVYKAAAAAFANGAPGVYVAKYNSETSTALIAILDAALNEGGWYGLVCAGPASTTYTTIATWCEANHKLFGFAVADNAGTLNPVGTTYTYTWGIVYDSNVAANAYIHVALMAKGFSYVPGTETWAYKTLAGITAGNYTSTNVSTFKTAGMNCYALVGGRSVVLDGAVTEGEWIDVVRYCDALASEIQAALYALLSRTVKVPYTASGLAAIESAIRGVLSEGQSVGAIAGTDYDAEGNPIPGYTVTVPDITNVTAATRATRVLSGVKFSARLSGAVHVVELVGTISE